MEKWPQIFTIPAIRGIARVSILFVSTVYFYFNGNRDKSILDYYMLRENWKRGVLIGCGIAFLYFGFAWLINNNGNPRSFTFPIGFSLWFNFIIGSPFAEELFFRGLLLQELSTILGPKKAIIVSSFSFALFHLPQWLILDHLIGKEVLSLFVTIFVYGIIFSILVKLTRSLWGSIFPHWINNFILHYIH